MVDYSSRQTSYKSVGEKGKEYSPGIADTLRILKEEIRIFKVDNARLDEA